MIKSFANKDTALVFKGQSSRKLPQDIQRSAYRKLLVLHAVEVLSDLRIPPSNHLEKLFGERQNQSSIRINAQWRICFEWHDSDAYEVEFVGYPWE